MLTYSNSSPPSVTLSTAEKFLNYLDRAVPTLVSSHKQISKPYPLGSSLLPFIVRTLCLTKLHYDLTFIIYGQQMWPVSDCYICLWATLKLITSAAYTHSVAHTLYSWIAQVTTLCLDEHQIKSVIVCI